MTAELTGETKQQADGLMAVFARRRPDGEFYYSDEDVRDFLPMMVIAAQIDFMSDPKLRELMAAFFGKIGFKPGMPMADLQRAIDGHYEENPANAELVGEFKRFTQSLASAGANITEGVNKVLGLEQRVAPSDEKPEDAVSLLNLRRSL